MGLELFAVALAILIIIGILLHQPSSTLGIPSLLVFMGIGLAVGNGELGFIYDNIQQTQMIGALALNMIVFVGGLNSSTENIRAAYKEGGVLSTLGVLLTTLIFAVIIHWLFGYDMIKSLLVGAIVSSTDAAAVFSILESKKLRLKGRTDTVLEFESATNDPVALLMVMILTGLMLASETQTLSVGSLSWLLVQQIGMGIVAGYVIGRLCAWLLNRCTLEEYGLIPVFILAAFVIAAYGGEILGGNILVAAYVAGVVIGNQVKRGIEVSRHFFNSLSWLAQAMMFIFLGLQIFPGELLQAAPKAILPGLLLIFIARPLAVQICYLFFPQVSWQKRLFVSAIGLKGATPLVFALYPAAAGVPGAGEILNMVFFVVLISVVVQGGVLEPLAQKLELKE